LSGFFRVNYDAMSWKRLHDVLNEDHLSLDVRTRAQLLDDGLSLARAGLLDYASALNSTLYLKDEMSFVAWRPADRAMRYIGRMLERTSGYGPFKVILFNCLMKP